MLLSASNEETMLTQILGMARHLLQADAYAVWREVNEGRLWRVIAKCGLSAAYRTEMRGPDIAPAGPWEIENVFTDPRLGPDRHAYEQEGIQSMMVVPWQLGAAIRGTIVFYWRTPRSISQEDRDFAEALVNLSAAALNRIELDRSTLAEKRRLVFLAEASQVLASSLDYEATLQQVARLAVPQIADWCTVHIVEDGVVSRLIVHAEPDAMELASEYSAKYPEALYPDRGLGKVLRTGEPEIYPYIPEELIVQSAIDAEHLRLLRKLDLRASILYPLIARGRVLGAIRLLGTGNRPAYTSDDVQLAGELALRAAAAIDNARLHRAVMEQESELRLSHAAARMGSWSWDQVHQKISWSPEFKLMHNLPPDAQPGFEGGRDLIHPDDRERVLRELAEALVSDAPAINQEHRAITPDGRVLWVQSRGRIDRDAQGRPTRIAGISIDVTESRLAEQALRRTEKLAAAGRLAATVAHEVNNPLEALVNLIYLAQRTDGLSAEAAEHLRIADGELSRMAQIVRQTLGFYRESVSPQQVDLGQLVAEVVELYRSRSLSRGLILSQKSEEADDLTALVNGGEIKQVVANLISNAVDATAKGGSVTVATRRIPAGVEITVADTGTGITEANRQHLFEPFFTTKSDVGTGLGLWVSKGIVEKHGGTITLYASSEAGSTFRVLLPTV
jgi:PAS domain S-box-containing protein